MTPGKKMKGLCSGISSALNSLAVFRTLSTVQKLQPVPGGEKRAPIFNPLA
jgi:hypothetical protein